MNIPMRLFVPLLIVFSLLTVSCGDGTDEPRYPIPAQADRTVLVYMSAENDLSGTYSQADLIEMRKGSKSMGRNNNLIVYVDESNSRVKPYLLRIVNGETADSIPYSSDRLASDPQTLRNVLQKVISRYPAKEYALGLWGHASGWLIESDSVAVEQPAAARRRAYGRDTGDNSFSSSYGTWLNIPTMASVLSSLPVRLKYIFCDCCNMMSVETAYELRDVTEYLIGSPAEIPGYGAPYETVVPAMMKKNDFAEAIVDNYYAHYNGTGKDVALSVIRTEGEGLTRLAEVTREVLYNAFHDQTGYPGIYGLIYYLDKNMIDMNDLMLRFASADDYDRWKDALKEVVVYKKMATQWRTNGHVYFSDFTVTEERYGGISIFVPQKPGNNDYAQYNEDIRKMGWYYAAGYSDIGW